jgi:hypothetical protein
MLAYVFWHRPAERAGQSSYERALKRFHRSLAHRPPSGFRGSAAFRLAELPWLAPARAPSTPPAAPATPPAATATPSPAPTTTSPASDPASGSPAYEDWYLVDDWSALGVLEEAAVSRGHFSAHDAIAAHTDAGAGAVYRLQEGSARPQAAIAAVWVTARRGHAAPSLGELLGDGMDPERDGLWRRCLVLGPAPEYCVLAGEPPAGVASSRLPSGWIATTLAREVVVSA